MQISFVIPSRNNVKYFTWAYNSIRKHQGDHDVYICAANDASTDGTVEFFKKLEEIDPKFKWIDNPGPERVGHTILYDRIINELVETEVAIIYHADMYLCPGALDEIESLMLHGTKLDAKERPQYKTIVSLTRIEPPLHPDGPEKYLTDWGVEPEQFNETAFLQWFTSPEAGGYKPKYDPPYTDGVFAPWAFFVKDFKEIGGHDPLYRPQSKEDSDIFNRFKLNGCKFIQTWIGCVYHMTCRGSRFNPTLTVVGKNSKEWEEHNIKSARNFIRKWGHYVQHTNMLHPIVPNRYCIEYQIKNSTADLIYRLEPYCDSLRCDLSPDLLQEYLSKESKNTDFDLGYKISGNILPAFGVYIDGNKINQDDLNVLANLQTIIQNSESELVVGRTYYVGNLEIYCYDTKSITKTLINRLDPEYTIKLK